MLVVLPFLHDITALHKLHYVPSSCFFIKQGQAYDQFSIANLITSQKGRTSDVIFDILFVKCYRLKQMQSTQWKQALNNFLYLAIT